MWRRLERWLSAKSTRELGRLQREGGNGVRVVVGAPSPRQGLRGLHPAPAFRLCSVCSKSRPSVMGDILSPAPPPVGPEPQLHLAPPHVLAQVWGSAEPARSQDRGHHTRDQAQERTPQSNALPGSGCLLNGLLGPPTRPAACTHATAASHARPRIGSCCVLWARRVSPGAVAAVAIRHRGFSNPDLYGCTRMEKCY